ncbi:unnamed protein product [Lathyrus sativus]|nr:unnamed protein product [Lathyrus sativus]
MTQSREEITFSFCDLDLVLQQIRNNHIPAFHYDNDVAGSREVTLLLISRMQPFWFQQHNNYRVSILEM